MYSKYFIIFLISITISECFCDTYTIPAPKQTPSTGVCEYSGSKIKIGEFKILDSCEKVICQSDYSMVVYSCESMDISHPDCKQFGTDKTKPYPKCCQTYCIKFEDTANEATINDWGVKSVN